MQKNFILVATLLLAVLIISGCQNKKNGKPESKSKADSQIENNLPTDAPKIKEVTPLQKEDNISSFFKLINEKRIPEAIAMMNPALYPDESSKQEYAVQFNAFEFVEAKSIEPFDKNSWTNDSQLYKVIINAKMKPGCESAPIPCFGWENGDNVRFISLEKINNVWLISAVATGP